MSSQVNPRPPKDYRPKGLLYKFLALNLCFECLSFGYKGTPKFHILKCNGGNTLVNMIKFEEMATKAVYFGEIGNFKKLNKEDVLEIIKLSS